MILRRNVSGNCVQFRNPAFIRHNARARVIITRDRSRASREDPHPITGIVPTSTSHRSIALNAASNCTNDQVDAHSRHSTHSDRRTHCLQLHVSYSASNPMRSIISNLSGTEIFIFTLELRLRLSPPSIQ